MVERAEIDIEATGRETAPELWQNTWADQEVPAAPTSDRRSVRDATERSKTTRVAETCTGPKALGADAPYPVSTLNQERDTGDDAADQLFAKAKDYVTKIKAGIQTVDAQIETCVGRAYADVTLPAETRIRLLRPANKALGMVWTATNKTYDDFGEVCSAYKNGSTDKLKQAMRFCNELGQRMDQLQDMKRRLRATAHKIRRDAAA